MRFLSLVAMLLLVAPVLVACGQDDEEPEPVSAMTLPANLCAAISEGILERWSLVEDDHATVESEDRTEATCSMSGAVNGEPVTLEVSLSSFAGADHPEVRALMDEEFADSCSMLRASGTGTVTDENGWCTSETPAEPAADRGAVTEYSRALGSNGISMVTMVHHGPLWSSVGAEVVAIGGTLSQTDPADLG